MSGLIPETRAKLDGLNDFLEVLYGEPRRVSGILREARLSDEEIAQLRREHLGAYLETFVKRYTAYMAQTLPERRCRIVVRRYGLDGEPRPTLAALGAEYGISRERVRQLQKRGLGRLKHHKCKDGLVRIAVETARELLEMGRG